MGIFGNDEEQDARLDALENHVRKLSESVHANQLDLAEAQVKLLTLQGQLDEKLTSEDIDPGIVAINEKLVASREELTKLSGAATESWKILNSGAMDALDSLRENINQANNRAKQ